MPHHGTYFNEKFSTSDPGPLGHLAGPRALRKNNYFLEPIREAGSPRLDLGEALPLRPASVGYSGRRSGHRRAET